MPATKLGTLKPFLSTASLVALGMMLFIPRGFTEQPAKETGKTPVSPTTPRPLVPAGKEQSERHYCRLVFGPKEGVRVLVCLEDKNVSIDRDGDGKFDGKGERFDSETDCKGIVIADPDGKTSYVITGIHDMNTTPPEKFLEVRVRIRGEVEYSLGSIIAMSNDPGNAPEARFHGVLTVSPKGWRIVNRASRVVENELLDVDFLLPQKLRKLAGKELVVSTNLPRSLKKSGEPAIILAAICSERASSWVCVCSSDAEDKTKSPFPKGIHPFVDVEFPAKKGQQPLKKRYALDSFCCDGCFQGSVRVPDEAGAGKARLTFSFDLGAAGLSETQCK